MFFFAYTLSLLLQAQQEALKRKFRVAILLVHCTPVVSTMNLFLFTHEDSLDIYVKRYISKRIKTMYMSDLGFSLFSDGMFFQHNSFVTLKLIRIY
jgi:hypothetical protein